MAVTGGASGIGFACAARWVAGGGRTVLLDLAKPALKAAVGDLYPAARAAVVDVTDDASVVRAFRGIREHEGRLDAVVNSAGISRPAPSSAVNDDDFAHMLNVHLGGAMRIARAAYPQLQLTGGCIVNLSSIAAATGMPGRASYTTAKAGIGGLTRTLAVEWASDGIRVNAVAPGYVRTALTDTLIARGELEVGPITARTPLRRFAEPAEVAEAVHFLATRASSYITGQVLVVDGGMSVDGDWFAPPTPAAFHD